MKIKNIYISIFEKIAFIQEIIFNCIHNLGNKNLECSFLIDEKKEIDIS